MRWLRRVLLHNWHLKLLSLLIAFLLWAVYTAEPIAEVGYLVPLEFRNLPPGLELAEDVPTQIHVRVRGRPAILHRITPAELSIAIDLSGAAPGELLVRLAADHLDLPPGVELTRISPAEVRIRLVHRAGTAAR
jgi:YbbR domain-containing protein